MSEEGKERREEGGKRGKNSGQLSKCSLVKYLLGLDAEVAFWVSVIPSRMAAPRTSHQK